MKLMYDDDLTKIYCGDSQEVCRHIKNRDLMLTDPPYGLGKRINNSSFRWQKLWKDGNPVWDTSLISPNKFQFILKRANRHIIWGGNFYPLPPSRCWLVWYKVEGSAGRANCELAWTNLDHAPEVYRMSRVEAYVSKRPFIKTHPTEKPLQIALWCARLAKPQSIIDPFMGTGNFLVAARMLEIPAVGIDISMEYCEQAISKISKRMVLQKYEKEKGGFDI